MRKAIGSLITLSVGYQVSFFIEFLLQFVVLCEIVRLNISDFLKKCFVFTFFTLELSISEID